MERRAEINRFAIFLFCLLVPLGSLAPTETSERKMTPALERFTTDIPHMSAVILNEAHQLFEFYNNCVSATLHREHWNTPSEARSMAEAIFKCQPFQPSCSVLHSIYNILKTMGSDIETICNSSSNVVVKANLNQLDTTLSQGTVFYTCKGQDPPRITGLADRKTYIWWVLKKYEDVMQDAVK